MKQNLLFNQASALGKRLAMVLTMLLIVGIGQAWGATFNVVYDYSTKGDTWTLTDCEDKSSYWLCPASGTSSVATIPDIFIGKTITSDVVITINNATFGSGNGASATTFKIYNSTACTTQVTASQSGTLASSSTYVNTIYTVTKANATNFSKDLVLLITKPGRQIRLKSISVKFSYENAAPAVMHKAYFYNGTTLLNTGGTEFAEGAAVSYSGSTPLSCDGMSTTFVGWATDTWTGKIEKGNIIPNFYDIVAGDNLPNMGTTDVYYYAVFAKKTSTTTSNTLTLNSSNLSSAMGGSYSSNDFSYSGISFGRSNAAIMSNTIQIKAGTSNAVWNKTELPGAITSITVTKKTNNSVLTVGTSAQPTTNSKTVSSTTTYTFTESNNYRYFKIAATSSYTQVTSVVIKYSATSYSYSDYITSCTTQTVPSLSVSGVSESSLAFGNVTVKSPQPLTFTLSGSNLTADATLALSGTNAGMFSVSPTPVTPSNGSITNQTITVTYTPTTKASHSATLTISSTDAKSIEISLSGTGVAQTANYTVKHYQQNITDDDYTLKETQTLSGEVGTNVTPAVNSYTGFTAPTEKSVEITADGNAIVEYRYIRNLYELKWNLDGGTITTAGTPEGAVKYGASLTAPVVEKDGFNFKGWSPSVPTTMPAADAIYTAQWKQVYTITWLLEGQPYTIGNPTTTVEEGQNITDIPSDPPLLTCAVKFMGWSTQSSGSTPQEPTYYSDLFTTLAEAQAISIEENTIFHAVFAMTQSGTQSETITTEKSSFTTISGILDDNISYNSYKGNGSSNPEANNGAIRLYQVSSDTKTGGYIVISAATGSITSASITSTETYASSYTGYILDYTKTYAPDKGNFEVNDYTLYKGQTYTVSGINNSAIAFACFSTNSNYRLEIAKISVTYTKEGAPSYTDYITSCCETPAPTNGKAEVLSGTSVKLTWEGSASSYHITGGNLAAGGVNTPATSYTISELTECETYTFNISAAPDKACESAAISVTVTPFAAKTITFRDGSTTTTLSTTCENDEIVVPTPTEQNCSTYVWKDEQGNEYAAGDRITPTTNMTITTVWTVNPYTVTFVDYDGTTVLKESEVNCGEMPTPPADPTREADEYYEYEFSGWTPTLATVSGDASYKATYNKTKRTYTVDWYVNGKLVKNETVEAGELATAPDLSKIPCGAVLAGWTDAPNGEYVHETSTLYPGEEPSIEILENKTLYAVFADIDE